VTRVGLPVLALAVALAGCGGGDGAGDDEPIVPGPGALDAAVADAGVPDGPVALDAAPAPDATQAPDAARVPGPDAAPAPDAAVSATPAGYLVTAAAAEVAAGATVAVTAQLVDGEGRPAAISGRLVSWGVTGGGAVSDSQSFTGVDGAARVTLRVSTEPGAVHVVSASDGVLSGSSASIVVIASPGPRANIAVDPPRIVADGASRATVTLTLEGAPAGTVTLQSSIGFLDPLIDHGGGVFTASLRSSTRSGVAILTARLDGAALEPRGEAHFDPGPPHALSVGAESMRVPPGGQVSIVAHLADVYGNIITAPGHTIFWSTNLGGSVAPAQGVTDDAGRATTVLTAAPLAGVVHVVVARDAEGREGRSPPITVE
jgi:hypothetical protein